MQTVRTTIRLRSDLLDQSRTLAFKRKVSLQDVINSTLAKGFGQISDIQARENISRKMDAFRTSLKDKKNNVARLVSDNKKELENRTTHLLKRL